ncbi:MAG: hypothetical protein JXR25_16525 [Pontiellaceae bacterium]|nr:hypothetical protein [Pontiellaceae bacterium]MBN2786427.1 hypothetical protein [Pontiellaceae bacterium]
MSRIQTLTAAAAFALLSAISVQAEIVASNVDGVLQYEGIGNQTLISSISRDDTASDTLWIKWTVFAYDNVDTENYWNGLRIDDGGTYRLGIGNSWDATAYSTFNGDLLNSANPDSTNVTYQTIHTNDVTTFIMRVDYNAGASDDVTIYMDPDLAITELGQDPALTTTLKYDMSFDSIQTDGGGGALVGWYYTNILVSTDASVDFFGEDTDVDSDGLPDSWETFYGLDPAIGSGDDGADGDPDTDGLVNSDELENGTNPLADDTDGDGLQDGEEVHTYFSDPLDSDSDDDYLSDGDEVNTHATDPADADSDDDGVNDATEVYAGSNPNDGGDVPENALPNLVGAEFFDYADGSIWSKNGGEMFDIDNNISNDVYVGHTGSRSDWYDSSYNAANVFKQGLKTSNGTQGLRAFNGSAAGGMALGVISDDPTTGATGSNLYFRVKMTASGTVSYAGFSLYNGGTEKLFFGKMGDSGEWGVAGADASTSMAAGYGPTNAVEYMMVGKIEVANRIATLWLDPTLDSGESANYESEVGGVSLVSGFAYNAIRLESGGSGSVRWDDLVVALTWEDLAYEGADSDADTLRDSWELLFTNSLAALTPGYDLDGDGLDDDEEMALATDPTSTDSDGDGLSDGDEVSSYFTDPADSDSDDDGLSDGDEINVYQTDPLDTDSDDDGYSDGIEVDVGTSPTNPTDNPGAAGTIIIDGILDAAIYGNAVSTQTVNTAWGDNYNELNAAYAYVANGKLYLTLTGNVEANGNILEILFDTTDAVTTNVLDAVNSYGGNGLDGLTFDTAFTPDYHCHLDRGDDRFEIADLGAQVASVYNGVFAGGVYASTGTGTVNATEILLAYDGSNTNGVVQGTGAASETTNSVSGLELCIDLADLGNPHGTIRICAFINGNNRDYLSNQTLGGLPAGTDSLGYPPSSIDFSTIEGDQFFTVEVGGSVVPGSFTISSMTMLSGGTEVRLTFEDLTVGVDYKVQAATDLSGAFSDVAGSQFTAVAATESVVLSTTNDVRFFKGTSVP